MDQLAACHFVHGFLRVPFHRRHHATSPSCKNVKVGSRSLSLTDRRGIISPARSTSKGLISPMSTGQRTRINSTKYSNDEEDLPRAVRLMRYNSQMHSVAGDPLGEVFYPAAQVGGVQRAGAEVRRWQWPSYRRKIDSSGQVLVSLSHHLTSNKLTISPIALRDIIVREKSKELQELYVKLWLIFPDGTVDKRTTLPKPLATHSTFNSESFSFHIPSRSNDYLKNANIVVNVNSYSKLDGTKAELGHALIGPLGDEEGQRQWFEMLDSDGPIIEWQKLSTKWE